MEVDDKIIVASHCVTLHSADTTDLELRIVEGRPEDFKGSDSGCVLWASSKPLAEVLWARHQGLCISGAAAIELGCGCGLASLTLAAAGIEVLATDGDARVLQAVTSMNAAANSSILTAPLRIAQLRWGDFESLEASIRTLGRTPTLLVASDVLYEPKAFEDLRASINFFASAAAVAGLCFWVLLSFQERCAETERAFLDSLAPSLPVVRLLHTELVPDPFADNGSSAVNVYQLSQS